MLGYDKVPLIGAETPLSYLPALSKQLGIELYIKRDDMTPLGTGGNKLRKLEYLLHDAKAKGATMLLTMGGVQTNHGRLTAAAAAAHGLKCVILCIDNYPGEISANLLLDRLMGARVIIKESDGTPEDRQFAELARAVRQEYEAAGEVVYEIPIGGSNVIGLLGYYECAIELDRQAQAMGISDATVITAAGSLGTYLGLFCGLKDIKSHLGLTGIAISGFDAKKQARLAEYFAEACETFGFSFGAEAGDFHVETEYVRGGYNLPDANVRNAIGMMAQAEGILLDPCYTGKAFAGVIDMISQGKLSRGQKVIFVHTGGVPGLYTLHHRTELEKELLDGVTIIKR